MTSLQRWKNSACPFGSYIRHSTNRLGRSLLFLNFGFIRASSNDFGVTKGPCVVYSYNGNNTYILIADAKQRCSWVFCKPSKSPPVLILERFVAIHGLKDGTRFLRMDQGGELWGSTQLRDIANAVGYIIEPTGYNSVWQNGKVERLNDTFGIMVRCLLYSSGLSATFWSAALIHPVYLKNRSYHKAIGMTPCEGWTGIKPERDHLRTFGALVTAGKPGKRPAKADRHTVNGVLLGFGSSTKRVRYFDLTTNREKLSSHHIIDEAHYGTAHRPAGAQVLMDMGYDIPSLPLVPLHPLKPSVYPYGPSTSALTPCHAP
jgi:hypothetical protein